jgi:hypothetical protein
MEDETPLDAVPRKNVLDGRKKRKGKSSKSLIINYVNSQKKRTQYWYYCKFLGRNPISQTTTDDGKPLNANRSSN